MTTHVLIMGYDKPERIKRTVERFFKETDIEGLDLTFTLVDARYPFPDAGGNTLTNANFIFSSNIAATFSIHIGLIILHKNLGQDGNYNFLSKNFEYQDEDSIVFFDTDHRPERPTWLKDKLKLLRLPQAGFVTMNCSCTDNALKNQGHEEVLNGVKCKVLCWPGGWPTGAWKGSFFRKGITQSHSYYGGSEGNILNSLRANGLTGYMMSEHDDLRDVAGLDNEYIHWKLSVINIPGVQKSFEEFLEERRLNS